MMFLEKVFEAHFFWTDCFKSCKIIHFLHAADQKTLKFDTKSLYSHGPLAAMEYLLMFSQTPLERGQSPLYEHIKIISIG